MTSSDEISQNLPPDDSLTTVPAQAKRLLTQIYAPAVPGTRRITPVSLPTQNLGMGSTNPVDLPPAQQPQQSQNPDGILPPGVMNEPSVPTTTTSARDRGIGNGGKKR